MDLEIRLLSGAEAERVVRGRSARAIGDTPWADEYPMDGDSKACVAYLSLLAAASASSAWFGYYQVVLQGMAVGGIGFHGPSRDGVVEVGYGVVPAVRRRGVATEALRHLLRVAEAQDGVQKVRGRTTEDNLASQRVMLAVGMQPSGQDHDFLRFEMELA